MLSSAMLSGCIWDDEVTTNVPEVEDDGFRAFSVVAPIDTGINVYHDHFPVLLGVLAFAGVQLRERGYFDNEEEYDQEMDAAVESMMSGDDDAVDDGD